MSVNKASPAVLEMQKHLGVVTPLMGGTTAMRAAGERLLIKFPNEDSKAYEARLKAATLLPAYQETVINMTGRVFAEPITIGEDVDSTIAEQLGDIDLSGNKLDVWAEDFFKTGLSDGLVFALVDVPRVEGLRTQAEEREAGVRPYAVKICVGQVLGWRSKGGKLTQFRYEEKVEEDDGQFGVKEISQIRVLEPGKWMIYRRGDKTDDEWKLHDEGTTTLDKIPLVAFYTGRTGYMTGKPPLLELAHLNVKHWNSQSDQDNILHVARVPILALNTDDEKFTLTVGSNALVKLGREGKLEYVEHSGQAIEAGQNSLDKLEEQMRMAGAKLTRPDKNAPKTAKEVGEDAAVETSPLQRMAGALKDALDNVLQLFADWQNVGDGGSVQVNGNFDEDFAPEVSLPALVSMANAGKLSDETLFTEMQRRSVISADVDWQEEKERIEIQGPTLGGLGDGGDE